MRSSSCSLLLLHLWTALALLCLCPSSVSGQASSGTQQVSWGYSLQCPAQTLDYPCLTQISGVATVNSTLLTSTYSGASYQYYQMLSFTGTRVYTNRFGTTLTTPVSLAPVGELSGNRNQLVLTAAALGAGTPAFRLASVVQFPGGLLGNEVEIFVTTGYLTESIAINGSASNSLNDNPASVAICSTAPGFTASAYNASTNAAAFYTTLAPCTAAAPFAIQTLSPTLTTAGLRVFAFSYSITDGVTFNASVNATLYTDGTVNYDALGNVYYQLAGMAGTRTEQSLLNLSATSTVAISSLMAPNIIFTSNLAYISNNNRVYPQYPYLDRYGLAYTVTSRLGAVTQPELNDGALYTYSNTIGAYIYRLDTLDEQGISGTFAYPAFNMANANQNALSLTLLPTPANIQLVFFCYVMYGLPNTLDYPWSVVVSGNAVINNTPLTITGQTSYGLNGTLPGYALLGFAGTRTYTSRFGTTIVSALTLDALGEDANVGYLVPVSPYAPQNSVSWHLNSTILTPGGLPATDLSFFLDPYPIEGTAFGVGIGTGTNALNNDPSRTLFVSNMPGFVNSTYSNANTATLAGQVAGTTDLSQCRAVPSVQTVSSSVTTPGLRVYQLAYSITGTGNYTSYAQLQLITDGSVQQDQLGNYYYNVAAASGFRTYTAPNRTVLDNVTVNALLPICSGPTVSNLDAIYCNTNRVRSTHAHMHTHTHTHTHNTTPHHTHASTHTHTPRTSHTSHPSPLFSFVLPLSPGVPAVPVR